MPAEWEPHEATWLSWPHNRESWPDRFDGIPKIWAEMAFHLHQDEKVFINVASDEMEREARDLLTARGVNLDQIRFFRHPTDDAWARDHGPIFIVRDHDNKREVAITDWEFNKWGGKYPPWDQDNAIPQKIASALKLPCYTPGIVMEGGSIDVNGQGLLLTTESCLLNPNRNPALSKEQIENYLKEYLGITTIYWLGDGIEGDDTDGHIDDLSRFVDATTIVTVVEKEKDDKNYEPLKENLRRLYNMRTPDGKPFRIVTLPMPKPIYVDGQRVPASYANFYIGNGAVLVPIYNDPNDAEAVTTLRRLFPNRKVVGIDCTELIWGLGAFHCVTQQQPLAIA